MKYLPVLIALTFLISFVKAQEPSDSPVSDPLELPRLLHIEPPEITAISASYFGELVTHPGLKIDFVRNFGFRAQNAERKSGSDYRVNKFFQVRPGIGFYVHPDYQTGVIAIGEFNRIRQTSKSLKRRFIGIGLGAGMMRTFIPKTFEVTADGSVEPTVAGHTYALASVQAVWGRRVHLFAEQFNLFLKPRFMLAMPNFPNSVGYFTFEIGLEKYFWKEGSK